jgi:protein SCO1/2
MIGLGLLFALAPVGGGAAVQIGGPFELVDQHGATRTDADFRGSYLLIYFGFTYCPDLCPTTLLKMASALEDLAVLSPAKADRVVPMFISVDPERDTPEVLRGYAEQFDPRLVALTGTPRALAKLGRVYGVFFAKVPTAQPGEYLVDHTSFVYLIGPDGKYVQHFESDVSVDDLVGALRQSVVGPTVGGN